MVVVCVMGIGGLLVSLLGASPVACAVATGLFMFGLSGSMNVCMSLTTSIYGRYDFPTAYTPISTIFNAFNFAGVSVISTIFALGGPQIAMASVFVICLIALISFMGAIMKKVNAKHETAAEAAAPAAVPAEADIPNRGELVAAISVALAEELGKDVKAIRIHSIKRV